MATPTGETYPSPLSPSLWQAVQCMVGVETVRRQRAALLRDCGLLGWSEERRHKQLRAYARAEHELLERYAQLIRELSPEDLAELQARFSDRINLGPPQGGFDPHTNGTP